jgi:uncharacterized membrane protein
MNKGRLEAFSDGVLAIIITIMVLELHVPHGDSPEALLPILPTILGYLLSFVFIAIYWNNHHHLFQAVKHVDGRILWANMHLLFWLSLTPFVTAWMGQSHFASWPVALYGGNLLMSGLAYYILERILVASHGAGSVLGAALGNDVKGKLSLVIYSTAVPVAFFEPLVSCALYVVVAIMWLIPDRRIEKTIAQSREPI